MFIKKSASALLTGSVTNAKLADMAQATIKGRASGAGTGVPVDLTGTQAAVIVDAVVGDSGSGGLKGQVPAPASGDAAAGKYLKADGTWAVPPDTGITQLTGPVTAGAGSGSQATTIASNVVTNANLLTVATATFKGRTTAGTGAPEDLTQTQAGVLLTNFIGLPRRAISSGDTATTTDKGGVIEFTGSSAGTLAYSAAATLGANWWCIVVNKGSGAENAGQLIHDPNGAETIDALTQVVTYIGDTRLVTCNGTLFVSELLMGGSVQYTTTGASTFTVPSKATIFELEGWGGGGSGGGGRRGAASGTRCGGGGGGGGAYSRVNTTSAQMGSSITVSVAGTTSGGAGGGGDSVSGTIGTNGNNTTVGTLVTAFGGGAGAAGGATTSAAGGGGGLLTAAVASAGGGPLAATGGSAFGGGTGTTNLNGGASGWGGAAGGGNTPATPAVFDGGCSYRGGPGGGGGGCITASNVAVAGGNGGSGPGAISGGGTSGGSAGTTGVVGGSPGAASQAATILGPGLGGAGGGAGFDNTGGGSASAAGAGSDAGISGGGGGGGASLNANAAGAGGRGGAGLARISYR